eukprot:GHVU01050848.1.p2 GENE.GHVU01050848.1~~GHVU01050848.1.p2  ORF type:complete len:125 (+),score=12.15 GHVU01050848.1:248-622(+)
MATMAFGIAWKQDDANAMGKKLMPSHGRSVAVESEKRHGTHLVPAYIQGFGFCINPYFVKGLVTKTDMPIVPMRAKLQNGGNEHCSAALGLEELTRPKGKQTLQDTGPPDGWGQWHLEDGILKA